MESAQRFIAVGSAFALAVGASSAIGDTVDVTKANGDFVAGTGIPGDGFVGASGGGVLVWLKARGRPGTGYSGVPINQIGNHYFVPGGSDPGGNIAWNFDFQFTPGDADTIGGTNYNLSLMIDDDPTAGENFAFSLAAPMFGFWDATDGYFENPKDGSWNDDTVDYVYSQSWRVDFGFIFGEILDPGDYTIKFAAMNEAGDTTLAEVEALVTVVPLPGAAGLGLAGMLGLGCVRRRRF